MKQLRRNLAAARNTVFGKQHDFTRLSVLGDRDLLKAYQSVIGVKDWYAFKDLIARIEKGRSRMFYGLGW